MLDFKGHRLEKDMILLCIRWYVAYPLSYRNLEERRAERGVSVDHTNINRWVQQFTLLLEGFFRHGRKQPVGSRGRLDETYIKIKGQWKYFYRAVDKAGQTVNFRLTAHRDKKAALRFLKKAIGRHGHPDRKSVV
jgi:transposase-like protein